MFSSVKSQDSRYYDRCFTFEVQEGSKALMVELKNKWVSETFAEYARVLDIFINKISCTDYTLVIKCSQFNVTIPMLRGMLKPFLLTYKNAGFRFVRVVTENPQKEFRRMVKQLNTTIGFSMEFYNSQHEKQEVYI